MWLTLGNTHVKVTRATDAEVEWLRSKASGLVFGNKKTLWTTGEVEQVRFFDILDSTFPAGFLNRVLKRATNDKIQVKVIDGRRVPPHNNLFSLPTQELQDAVSRLVGVAWLRDYQLEAVAQALRCTRGIIKVPTGGGKTEIAIALVKQAPACKWLFLVHRKTLMEQAAERFELRCPGESAGRIGSGAWTVGQAFTVATFQTLAKALKERQTFALNFLAQFDGVVVDECHVLPAESFWKVAMGMVNAYWRIGVSGTPLDREDQRSVYAVAALEEQIYEIAAQTLIDEGQLARPFINMVEVHQEFIEKDKYGLLRRWPWRQVYQEGVVRSLLRNRTLLAAAQRALKPGLVFVKEVAHGKAFNRALQKRGLKSDFVWGSDSLQSRKDAVRRLVRGDLDILVCSVIFQEGLDVPELNSVIIGSGGKSIIAALQRIGRGMRKSAGKTTFEVWDVADTGHPWLERHARARRRAYQREGYATADVRLVPLGPVSP